MKSDLLVGVGGLEPPAPASQTRCAANCATPRTMANGEYNANRLLRQMEVLFIAPMQPL